MLSATVGAPSLSRLSAFDRKASVCDPTPRIPAGVREVRGLWSRPC
jgi:hypothetical protein